MTASRWRPTRPQLVRLVAGLVLFGIGEALVVDGALGNSPWTVLAEGVGEQTPLGTGAATVVISFVLLAIWIPLRQRPGLGTLANAVVIGTVLGVALTVLPSPDAVALRAVEVLVGIAVVAVGSGFYLTARLGPGPRDGLMTGLSRRTGASIRLTRAGIELTACAGGALLGGTIGLGTIAFALLIGPGVQAALAALGTVGAADL